jgi:hypothetical protein
MAEILRFYEDLGIIPNLGSAMEHNENLSQGQSYMEHRRNIKRNVKVIEGFGVAPKNKNNTSSNSAPASVPTSSSSSMPTSSSTLTSSSTTQNTMPLLTPSLPSSSTNFVPYKPSVNKNSSPNFVPYKPPTANVNSNANVNGNTNKTSTPNFQSPAPAPAPATSYTNNKKTNLKTYEIDLDATTFRPVNSHNYHTLEGRRENSILETRSIKYHYLAWLFFAIFIIWAIFNISTFSISYQNLGSEFQPAQTQSNAFSMIVTIILVVILIMVISNMNSSSIKTTVKIYDKDGNAIKNDKNDPIKRDDDDDKKNKKGSAISRTK